MLSVNSVNTFPSGFGVPNILIAARVRGNSILTPVFSTQNVHFPTQNLLSDAECKICKYK